jgi:hypothetical protein
MAWIVVASSHDLQASVLKRRNWSNVVAAIILSVSHQLSKSQGHMFFVDSNSRLRNSHPSLFGYAWHSARHARKCETDHHLQKIGSLTGRITTRASLSQNYSAINGDFPNVAPYERS